MPMYDIEERKTTRTNLVLCAAISLGIVVWIAVDLAMGKAIDAFIISRAVFVVLLTIYYILKYKYW